MLGVPSNSDQLDTEVLEGLIALKIHFMGEPLCSGDSDSGGWLSWSPARLGVVQPPEWFNEYDQIYTISRLHTCPYGHRHKYNPLDDSQN